MIIELGLSPDQSRRINHWPGGRGFGEGQEAYHTARWPHEPVSFVGKRVAAIGTGATAVQAITEIAKTVGHLTVFQRTPN